MRQLEHAGAAIVRAGERALLVTEDLALEQRLGNRGAVDRHERKRRAGAELVNGLRDQLLAGARLAPDQHRGVGRRRLFDHAVDAADAGAVADDAPEAALLAQLAAQLFHFAQRLLPLDRLLQQDAQPRRIDRLAQVVVGAFLDRLDSGFDGALRGEQDERQVGQLVLQRAQKFEPAHARHHQVGHDDRGTEGRHFLHRLFSVRGLVGLETPGADKLGQAHTRVAGSSSTMRTRSPRTGGDADWSVSGRVDTNLSLAGRNYPVRTAEIHLTNGRVTVAEHLQRMRSGEES